MPVLTPLGLISPVRLHIIRNGSFMAECKALVDELGLEACAELYGECQEAHMKLCNFDIFTLFSKSEDLPISIIEAMAARLPINASEVRGGYRN